MESAEFAAVSVVVESPSGSSRRMQDIDRPEVRGEVRVWLATSGRVCARASQALALQLPEALRRDPHGVGSGQQRGCFDHAAGARNRVTRARALRHTSGVHGTPAQKTGNV